MQKRKEFLYVVCSLFEHGKLQVSRIQIAIFCKIRKMLLQSHYVCIYAELTKLYFTIENSISAVDFRVCDESRESPKSSYVSLPHHLAEPII